MQQSQAADKPRHAISDPDHLYYHSWVIAACCVRTISRLNILRMELHAYMLLPTMLHQVSTIRHTYLQCLRTKATHGSTSHSNSCSSLSRCSCVMLEGSLCASQAVHSGRQPICEGSTYTIPQRLTVAGLATARSWTSKIRFMAADICMISPAAPGQGRRLIKLYLLRISQAV